MRLVLDTSALFEPALLAALVRARGVGAMERGAVSAVLPAVAYAERIRQLRRDGRDETRWKADLANAGILVEPFGSQEAEAVDAGSWDDAMWRRHARDFLVSAHASSGGRLVTSDGGAAWRAGDVLTPRDAARAVLAISTT